MEASFQNVVRVLDKRNPRAGFKLLKTN